MHRVPRGMQPRAVGDNSFCGAKIIVSTLRIFESIRTSASCPEQKEATRGDSRHVEVLDTLALLQLRIVIDTYLDCSSGNDMRLVKEIM